MCARFTQYYTWAEVQEFLSVFGTPRNLQPHFNITPTMAVDVIRLGKDGARVRYDALSVVGHVPFLAHPPAAFRHQAAIDDYLRFESAAETAGAA